MASTVLVLCWDVRGQGINGPITDIVKTMFMTHSGHSGRVLTTIVVT